MEESLIGITKRGSTMSVIKVAKNKEANVELNLKMANRHGLIAGATGTGKTFTLKRLAQEFSRAGVPVFLADVKGDVSGMAKIGMIDNFLSQRLEALKISSDDFVVEASSVQFWDLYGKNGVRIRTTVSELGPLLLARVLDLNQTQEAVLSIVFRVSDEQGLLLIDLKDLRMVLQFVAENSSIISKSYGQVSSASIASIQRAILALEDQGGDQFFGEPAINIQDFIRFNNEGHGIVNILEAKQLFNSPKIYSLFLLWIMSELYENLPEVGDLDKPKLVFFFDEAHLLFNDIPSRLLDKVEQVVRLIRSKGVGIYFITQNPVDIPDNILGQLSNKIQHALRSFTPKDQKAIRACAQTYRTNPKLNIERLVQELEVGQAIISLLDEKGSPGTTECAYIIPPGCYSGALTDSEISDNFRLSEMYSRYSQDIDNQSAFEVLSNRNKSIQDSISDQPQSSPTQTKDKSNSSEVGKLFSNFARSAARQIGSQVGRSIMRGIMGGIFKSK